MSTSTATRPGQKVPTATETILPFAMQHETVANPALAAWKAAPPNPRGGRDYNLDEELDYYYHVPEDAKAVVYLFHGGESSALMWLTGEEEAALIGDLVRNRYAVALLESTHRPVDANWFFPDPARFDPDSSDHPGPAGLRDSWDATVNADEQLLRDVHALLGYDGSTKVFLAGFSSGAKFACAMAYNLKCDPPALNNYYYTHPRVGSGGGLNVRAAAIYNNIGVPYYFGNYVAGPDDPASVAKARQYTTPTIFNYGLNDPKNDPSEVAATADSLGRLPVPVTFEKHLGEPTPLLQDRFARVLGVSYAESRDLYAALVAKRKYVDANGIVQPAADEALAVTGLPADKRKGVEHQLKALRAEHYVSSAHHDRTVAFFEAHR